MLLRSLDTTTRANVGFANADSSPRSAAAAKDNDQGVAGGLERACDRPEDEPHLRYAAARLMCRRVLTVDVSRDLFFFRCTGITSEGYSGKGFVTTK